MTGGAIIGGRLSEDNNHTYDIARRYQVKPGDINKILREAEKYADKGYGYFKRNCTTFAVDMVKSIGLSIGDEIKEDEMVFEGTKRWEIETATAGNMGGYFMGANAISSRLHKNDYSYQNFGQKLYTKEDLDRYYRTAGTGDVIKRGYSPGAAGETLRRSQGGGELGANFKEHDALKLNQLQGAIEDAGMDLWHEILLYIPREQLTDYDFAMQQEMVCIGDGQLRKLCEQKGGYTPDEVRAAHKQIRTAMKKINVYYRERLGEDARLNSKVMTLLSLYESALGYADIMYGDSLHKAAKGEAGLMRYDFTRTKFQVGLRDAQGARVETKMEPGVYEGYLMAGKTPAEAIREHALRAQIAAIPESERTKKQQADYERLNRVYQLAHDFASANRYLLNKDSFSDKDLRYAFNELPRMENKTKEGESLNGALLIGHMPSHIYQAVIYEPIFGGFRNLELETIEGTQERADALDEYLMQGVTNHGEMLRRIVRSYIDGKDKTTNALVEDYLLDLKASCIDPAYENVADITSRSLGIIVRIFENSRFATWLRSEINTAKNQGGGE